MISEMNAVPLVSICMITFNHEAYVTAAIGGVLSQQTSFPIELVIGEDCSSDRTREICAQYEQSNPAIVRVLRNRRNLGVAANFIQTFQACRGKYIALCEGDDFWVDPQKLCKQVEVLESNPAYSMVASNSIVLNEERQTSVRTELSISGFSLQDMLEDNLLGRATCSIVVRRECITANDLHFLSKVPFGDWALSLLCLNKRPGGFLADVTGCYRIHNKGMWNGMQYEDQLKNRLKMYAWMQGYFPEHRHVIAANAKKLQVVLHEYQKELALESGNKQSKNNLLARFEGLLSRLRGKNSVFFRTLLKTLARR